MKTCRQNVNVKVCLKWLSLCPLGFSTLSSLNTRDWDQVMLLSQTDHQPRKNKTIRYDEKQPIACWSRLGDRANTACAFTGGGRFERRIASCLFRNWKCIMFICVKFHINSCDVKIFTFLTIWLVFVNIYSTSPHMERELTAVTVTGRTDAQVGEVGGQAARAVGRAEGGEGHSVLGVQRSGQWRRELDVGQIRKRTAGVVCSWEHRWVQFLVWWWEYTKKIK